jgi:hypothetical protein
MPVINPTGVTAQGNVKLIFVATVVSQVAPKLTETGAASSLDLSCFIYEGGWEAANETNKGPAPRRLCSRVVYEKFGTTTQSINDLMYTFSPQAAALSDGKKAYEKLVEGTAGYFVVRYGLDAILTDFAIGQFVNVHPVVLGPQRIGGDTSDEFAEISVSQPVAQTGPTVQNVAMVA